MVNVIIIVVIFLSTYKFSLLQHLERERKNFLIITLTNIINKAIEIASLNKTVLLTNDHKNELEDNNNNILIKDSEIKL